MVLAVGASTSFVRFSLIQKPKCIRFFCVLDFRMLFSFFFLCSRSRRHDISIIYGNDWRCDILFSATNLKDRDEDEEKKTENNEKKRKSCKWMNEMAREAQKNDESLQAKRRCMQHHRFRIVRPQWRTNWWKKPTS